MIHYHTSPIATANSGPGYDPNTPAPGGLVAHVLFDAPSRMNAMNRAMWHELRRIFTQILPENTDVRCVVLAGSAGHFCAGGDISEYPEFRFDSEKLRFFHEEEVAPALHAILQCDVPVIAHIEGSCMGAGLEIACCSDIRIAHPDSRFGAPIAKLGFPMALQELAIVLAAAGPATVRAMLLEAAILDAQTLLQRGFLHAVVDDVAQTVRDKTQRIGRLAPQSLRLNKQALRLLQNNPSGPALTTYLASAYDYADSAEHREGISAFIAKRPPLF